MKNSTTFLGAAVLLLTVTLCAAQSTQTFTFQGDVFQTYVVPTSGWYLIDAKGAQGGPAGSHVGGKGARMQAYAQLLQGDILRIAIGGAGNSGSNDGNNVSGGGGGGASSVVNQTSGNTLLVMAGGGGGAGSNHDGDPGLVTTNGGSSGGSGGTNGSGGGISADNRGGGGGGGYSGGGGTHCDGNCSGNNILAQGGSAYIVDNFGGASTSIGGFGGWGGGGQGGPAINNFLNNNDGGGGGGGGYSGGGGGTEGRGGSATGTGGSSGGGGGGSFVSNNLNTSGCVAVNGENSGNGLVSVQLMNYTYVQPVDTGFTFQGNVFQYFTAPATGYYSVSARGAQGGAVNGANGGKGAHIQGAVLLSAGEILRIAVGGAGRDGEYGILSSFHENNSLGCSAGTNRAYWTGGGGGGASSIVALQNGDFIPLMIAAGGGGAANYFPGNPGSCTSSGTTSASPYSTAYVATTAAWGDNGNGGSGANAAGGGGFYSNGITSESVISDDVCIQSAYGQGYLSGNYGGFAITAVNQVVVAGGWGGGASGAFYDEANTRSFDGSGGGGGGYNGGGGGNRFYDPNQTSAFPFGGGGGGSLSQALCGRSDSSGVNTGNGSVSISGPNVTIDTVNTPGPTYTWAANGVTYQHSGTYYHVDQANCIVQVLDLSIGGLGGCLNYTRIDTTIVSCGSYTSPLNGRTYTENTTDSIRVGCTKYVVRLIVAAPAVLPGNMITGSVIQPGNMITGSTSPTSPLSVCKNSTGTYSIAPVPYATSYQWTLPSGAIGTSTTNSITVSFGNNFSGGNICVTPVNACGSGEVVCKAITLLNTPPTGPLQITGPSAPFISGNYSVTPIAGATTYTWSVSNNQAVIVSGQGTPSIQLEALPGFTHANLSVRASNCRGNGSRGTLALKANGNGPGAALPVRMAAVEAEMMSVYPNPSNGQFTLNTPMLDTDAMVEVYSTEGRLVFQKIIAANTTQTSIDLQQAASGLYQLRVVSGEEVKTARVVVE